MPKMQLGAATLPFESGFESTGSDVDSEREPASITDVGLENASSQLELYDLEVASIGFSEMSWQNDNQSLREYRRENIDRFKHFAPHLDFNEHGSSFSDRNTRSDLDRLSDVMERDSSTDSDGSFTCSEYEYGDERIASNKLRRKRLVFSTHPKQSEALDSDLDSSFRPRQNSHCSSMTSITDVGSIDRRGSANLNVSLIPPINWDELLNWGMKYENLADVYRTLASLDVVSKAPRPTPQHDTGERGHRLQSGSERGSSAHSSQEVYRKPTVLFSTEDTHEEEYV
ncbi:MAG: hypothetical protein GY818_15645 [Planctomycetaceae bacterium]|nr:hypothetical protein [Planctomycetaceae bacterium]